MSDTIADTSSSCHYAALGVETTASDTVISKAYKRLALKYHPDKNPDDRERSEEVFKRVAEAYEILHNPAKRRVYDQRGKAFTNYRDRRQSANSSNLYADVSVFGSTVPSGGVSSEEAYRIFSSVFGCDKKRKPLIEETFFIRTNGPDGTRIFQIGATEPSVEGLSSSGHTTSTVTMPEFAVPLGSRVVVRGLSKAVEHNGLVGKIAAWDAERKRYKVAVEGSSSLLLRQFNFTQLSRVELAGLEGKPQLNGQFAEISNFDEQRGRYKVVLEGLGSFVLSLNVVNCILPLGTCVIIKGVSNMELNNQMGQIVAVSRDVGRYVVRCQGGRQLRVKFDKVLC